MLGYPVAGFGNSTRPGERCYNFVWYRPVEEAARVAATVHRHRRQAPRHVDPAAADPRRGARGKCAARADDLLSPQFAEVVRHTRQPFFQAIFDLESPQIAFGRVALLGDAAFVARPHCGMGVTKAAGDAMTLADLLRDLNNDIPAALARYEASRARFGSAVVSHARELGAYLQGSTTAEAARHHTPEAVMREIAVTQDYV